MNVTRFVLLETSGDKVLRFVFRLLQLDVVPIFNRLIWSILVWYGHIRYEIHLNRFIMLGQSIVHKTFQENLQGLPKSKIY